MNQMPLGFAPQPPRNHFQSESSHPFIPTTTTTTGSTSFPHSNLVSTLNDHPSSTMHAPSIHYSSTSTAIPYYHQQQQFHHSFPVGVSSQNNCEMNHPTRNHYGYSVQYYYPQQGTSQQHQHLHTQPPSWSSSSTALAYRTPTTTVMHSDRTNPPPNLSNAQQVETVNQVVMPSSIQQYHYSKIPQIPTNSSSQPPSQPMNNMVNNYHHEAKPVVVLNTEPNVKNGYYMSQQPISQPIPHTTPSTCNFTTSQYSTVSNQQQKKNNTNSDSVTLSKISNHFVRTTQASSGVSSTQQQPYQSSMTQRSSISQPINDYDSTVSKSSFMSRLKTIKPIKKPVTNTRSEIDNHHNEYIRSIFHETFNKVDYHHRSLTRNKSVTPQLCETLHRNALLRNYEENQSCSQQPPPPVSSSSSQNSQTHLSSIRSSIPTPMVPQIPSQSISIETPQAAISYSERQVPISQATISYSERPKVHQMSNVQTMLTHNSVQQQLKSVSPLPSQAVTTTTESGTFHNIFVDSQRNAIHDLNTSSQRNTQTGHLNSSSSVHSTSFNHQPVNNTINNNIHHTDLSSALMNHSQMSNTCFRKPNHRLSQQHLMAPPPSPLISRSFSSTNNLMIATTSITPHASPKEQVMITNSSQLLSVSPYPSSNEIIVFNSSPQTPKTIHSTQHQVHNMDSLSSHQLQQKTPLQPIPLNFQSIIPGSLSPSPPKQSFSPTVSGGTIEDQRIRHSQRISSPAVTSQQVDSHNQVQHEQHYSTIMIPTPPLTTTTTVLPQEYGMIENTVSGMEHFHQHAQRHHSMINDNIKATLETCPNTFNHATTTTRNGVELNNATTTTRHGIESNSQLNQARDATCHPNFSSTCVTLSSNGIIAQQQPMDQVGSCRLLNHALPSSISTMPACEMNHEISNTHTRASDMHDLPSSSLLVASQQIPLNSERLSTFVELESRMSHPPVENHHTTTNTSTTRLQMNSNRICDGSFTPPIPDEQDVQVISDTNSQDEQDYGELFFKNEKYRQALRLELRELRTLVHGISENSTRNLSISKNYKNRAYRSSWINKTKEGPVIFLKRDGHYLKRCKWIKQLQRRTLDSGNGNSSKLLTAATSSTTPSTPVHSKSRQSFHHHGKRPNSEFSTTTPLPSPMVSPIVANASAVQRLSLHDMDGDEDVPLLNQLTRLDNPNTTDSWVEFDLLLEVPDGSSTSTPSKQQKKPNNELSDMLKGYF
ncbi:hypothetical protein C9374_009094 [Naegleria lovaniensis]|uniref:Uncharacterized protein n=1 Tax=Naegleria lovaniensis TaxID=51637 RepID=A0AA88KH88_NAELO|nr:uncharacterized protein C9374_009094 [Naegleria lovaniensis]KAG2377578.1 hypothetical protein C9374_009094 [Naegleria lovaniensis]